MQCCLVPVHRQLQLCLQGVRIFLDVDDLKETGELENYIKRSAVVLIFLSKNYFSSRNCRREADATASMGKRLTLVHEADPRYAPPIPSLDRRPKLPEADMTMSSLTPLSFCMPGHHLTSCNPHGIAARAGSRYKIRGMSAHHTELPCCLTSSLTTDV